MSAVTDKVYPMTDIDRVLLIGHNLSPDITHYTYRGLIKSKTMLGADIFMFIYFITEGKVYMTTIWRTQSGQQDGIATSYAATVDGNMYPLLPDTNTLYYVGDNLSFKASDLNIYKLRIVNNETGKSQYLIDIC